MLNIYFNGYYCCYFFTFFLDFRRTYIQLIQSDRRKTYRTAIQCKVLPSTGSFVMSVYRFYRILETFNINPLRHAGQHDTICTTLYI
jgi:hypothetical protein